MYSYGSGIVRNPRDKHTNINKVTHSSHTPLIFENSRRKHEILGVQLRLKVIRRGGGEGRSGLNNRPPPPHPPTHHKQRHLVKSGSSMSGEITSYASRHIYMHFTHCTTLHSLLKNIWQAQSTCSTDVNLSWVEHKLTWTWLVSWKRRSLHHHALIWGWGYSTRPRKDWTKPLPLPLPVPLHLRRFRSDTRGMSRLHVAGS